MLSKPLSYKQIPVNTRPEKVVRDVVRLEIAALLHLARLRKNPFMSDVMMKATPEQMGWIKDELKKLEKMLRTKVEAVDEA